MTRSAYVRPTASRVIASTLGALPLSMLVAAVVARFLPAPAPIALAVAYMVWIPLWLAAACAIACTRSASRAWLITLGSTAVVAVCTFAIPH